MTNNEARMKKETQDPNVEGATPLDIRHSGFVILSSFWFRCWALVLALLWMLDDFAVLLPAAEPPGQVPKHATPQAAFDAFRTAAQKKDWPLALRSCATRLQNHLLASNIRIGYRIAEDVPERKSSWEAMLRRHAPQLDAWKQELRAKANEEKRAPLVNELVDKIRDGVADKPALLADVFAWLTKLGIDHGLPADGVVEGHLSNLTIDGQRAKGVAVTGDEDGIVEFPVEFIREADGWRLMLPEL
jgi:hypothetical protein